MTPITCERFQAVLYEFVDGELESTTRFELEHHVEGCHHCGNLYDTYQATVTMTRALPRTSELPASFSERLQKLLKELQKSE